MLLIPRMSVSDILNNTQPISHIQKLIINLMPMKNQFQIFQIHPSISKANKFSKDFD